MTNKAPRKIKKFAKIYKTARSFIRTRNGTDRGGEAINYRNKLDNAISILMNELEIVEKYRKLANINNRSDTLTENMIPQEDDNFAYSASELDNISVSLQRTGASIDDIRDDIEHELLNLQSIVISDVGFDDELSRLIEIDLETTGSLVRSSTLSMSRYGRYFDDDEYSDKFDYIAWDVALQCANAALVLANIVDININRYEKTHASIIRRGEYKREMNIFFNGIAEIWKSIGGTVNYKSEYRNFFEAIAAPVCRYYAHQKKFGMSWSENWQELFKRHVSGYLKTHEVK